MESVWSSSLQQSVGLRLRYHPVGIPILASNSNSIPANIARQKRHRPHLVREPVFRTAWNCRLKFHWNKLFSIVPKLCGHQKQSDKSAAFIPANGIPKQRQSNPLEHKSNISSRSRAEDYLESQEMTSSDLSIFSPSLLFVCTRQPW